MSSGIFDLALDDRAALDEQARLRPLDAAKLPAEGTDGLGDALKGFLRPSAGAGRALALAAYTPLSPFLTEGGKDWYFREVVDDLGSNAVDYWTPDPQAMGATAKVVNTLANVTGSIPQMIGMPGVFLANAGFDPAVELQRQGVDTGTAMKVGAASLLANAAGMRMPAAFGSTLGARVATGAGSNLALGAAQDAVSAGALASAGYDEQAAGYNLADPYARGLDTLMGAAFGAKAHIDSPMTPTQRDAVLVANNHDHLQRRAMPGEPLNEGAVQAHGDGIRLSIQQLMAGEQVNVADAINPADFMLRPELQPASTPSAGFESAVARVLRDEGGFVDNPADRGGATNFGISSRAHPDVDVRALTRDQAVDLYRERYWNAIEADRLPEELQGAAFDAAVNQGVGWTRRALEQADGDLGAFLKLREARYRAIAEADPSQRQFLRGWLNRVGRYRETSPAGEALRDRLLTDPDKLTREYAALEDSKGGTVLNTDTARELAPEYLADRTRSADVHEAASDTIKTIYEAKLAQPTPEGFENTVLFTAGGTGAGKTTAIRDAGERFGKPEITYDTNMNTLGSAIDKVEQALSAGRQVQIAYVYRDPVEALAGGAIPRAQGQVKKFGSGRTVPLEEHARTHLGVRPTIDALIERYRDNPNVAISFIDNSRGKGNARFAELADIPRLEDNSLRERLQQALEQSRAGGLDEALYRGFLAQGRPSADLQGAGGPARASDGRRAEQGDRGQVSPAETPLDAASRLLAQSPDFQILDGVDPDGAPRYRSLAEAMAEIDAERTAGERDATGYQAAANCFLRNGAA